MDIWITLSEKAFSKINLGMLNEFNVACCRINMVREKDEWINSSLNELKQAGFNLKNIFLDIGNNKPRIIISDLSNPIFIKKQDEIFLSKGGGDFTVSQQGFFDNIAVGNSIIAGDGALEFEVVILNDSGIMLRSLSEGNIKNLMSLFVPANGFSDFQIEEKEFHRVTNILKKFKVSLMLSFVQNEKDIISAKEMFPDAALVVPKIETEIAIKNIDTICNVADKLVIGRGDLGLAIGVEKVGIIQDQIVQKIKSYNKKVIIATETLESFTFRSFPFRAEVIDITNSFTSGVEAVLLTSETASINAPWGPIAFLRKTINYLKELEV